MEPQHPQQTVPKKVHELLKARREQKRFSHHSIRQESKIPIAYLEALESGRWDVFPAEVYLIGSLRKYAAYLGLDPEEMVQLYRKEQEVVHQVQEVEIKKEVEVRKEKENFSLIQMGILGLLILVLGGWWLFSLLKHAPAPEKKSPPEPVAELQKKISHAAAPVNEDLALNMEANDQVWVRVTADQALLFEGFLPAGAVRSWTAKQNFVLRFGNVKAVRVTLNGIPVNVLSGAKQDVNEIELTHQSLKDANHPPEEKADTPPSNQEKTLRKQTPGESPDRQR